MTRPRIIVVGGGAAGFFGAIAAAEAAPGLSVSILEKGGQCLTKVRISGGGRCNVTHDGSDVRTFAAAYPRGAAAMIGALHRFGPSDTVAWFESRGVTLKVEKDGRLFPISDASQTIVDCLWQAAQKAGVTLATNRGVETIAREVNGDFTVNLSNGESVSCQRLLLATGGCRGVATMHPAAALGHGLEPPVPSLFTFEVDVPWLRALPGVCIDAVEVAVPETGLRERGPLLVTHWGLSGPVILRLSAWGARVLHGLSYRFPVRVNWVPDRGDQDLMAELQALAQRHAAKLIVKTPLSPLPGRLWEQLVLASGIARQTRWSALTRAARHRLTELLNRTELPVTGKSLNKEEFVTCGGIRLREVDFKTMESRICPGLYFAGELLDIDGLTGGYNFQAAWTTGWIAGQSMVDSLGR